MKTQTGYQAVGKVLEALIENEAHVAVAYLSDKFVVRMTRKLYKKRIDRREKSTEIVLTIGKPNYEQREFIKQCKIAGEPFPVKKVQLKFPPKQRK